MTLLIYCTDSDINAAANTFFFYNTIATITITTTLRNGKSCPGKYKTVNILVGQSSLFIENHLSYTAKVSK